MELKSMKLPVREQKAQSEPMPADMPREEYPWGLRIHLQAEQLDQLGIDGLPEPGTEVQIVAVGRITDAHISASEGSKEKHKSMGVQITELGLTPGKAKKKQSEDVFYSEE